MTYEVTPLGHRVFSCEISAASGARHYIVAPSYERFWHHYSRIAADRRHHYEIIREDSPCHLYFGAAPLRCSAVHHIATPLRDGPRTLELRLTR